MNSSTQKKLTMRFLISMLIAFLFGYLVSEVSFQLLTSSTERENEDLFIEIPEGTAERIKKGLPVPTIPESMVFFEGDRIIVQNNDLVSHQLGPVWVPSGSSGILTLEKPQSYSLSCTFQPTQIMGMEVRPRLTNDIRFQGILAIGLPSGVLIWLFSIVLYPIESKNQMEENLQ